jgi:hypothetical protein
LLRCRYQITLCTIEVKTCRVTWDPHSYGDLILVHIQLKD